MSSRTQNLVRANAVRSEVKALKKEIRSMPRSEAFLRCAELLEQPSRAVGSMELEQLLSAVYRVGPQWIEDFLRGCGVNVAAAGWRVRDLEDRHREYLIGFLKERAGDTPLDAVASPGLREGG